MLGANYQMWSGNINAHVPEPQSAEDFEGRETWDVVLYLEDGATRVVPCGTLREGVSREIAARVFRATRTTG